MKTRTITLLAFTALCLVLGQRQASAHAFLDHADPRVGSSLDKSPAQIKLWFTQQPELAFSTVRVLNADGKAVDQGGLHADPSDAKELILALPALPAGVYKVVWHVLSIDTHRTQGDFKFTIK